MSEKTNFQSIKSVFVAMGSSDGRSPEIRSVAQRTGALLARNGYELVYGGGEIGLMGLVAFAYAAEAPKQKPFACITEAFAKMSGNLEKAETRVEKRLHDRVAYMLDKAELTIILPGGIGTFHEKATGLAVDDMMRFDGIDEPLQPVIVVNTDGYYDFQLMQFAQMCMEDQAYPEKFRPLFVVQTPEEAIDLLNHLASKPLITSKSLFKGAELDTAWPASFADQIPHYAEMMNNFRKWQNSVPSQQALPLTPRP